MAQQQYTCPNCGKPNPAKASQCAHCGRRLSSAPPPSPYADSRPSLLDSVNSFIERAAATVRDLWEPPPSPRSTPPSAPSRGGTRLLVDAPKEDRPAQAADQNPRTTKRIAPLHESPPAPASQSQPLRGRPQPPPAQAPSPAPRASLPLKPLPPGLFQGRYLIQNAGELSSTVYYDAVDLRCANPQCHHGHTAFPADGLCVRCNVPLEPVLVHEWRTTNQDIIPQNIRGQLLRLGQSQHPYILYHREILSFQQATYTVVNHPGRWGVLIKGRRPRPIDEVLGSVAQVGKAINYLHQQGYSLNWPAPSYEPGAFERMINAPGRGDVRLASVSSCAPLQEKTRQAQIARDVALLGQLMLLLSSDVPSLPAEPAQAPAELRPFVERALRGQYPNVTKMLSDLSGSAPPPPAPARSLKPIHGQASHPGRKHDRNEDAILTFTYDKEQQGKSIPIAFYLVADGMGGHDAGDLASRTVNRIVTEWVLNTKVLPDLRKSTRKLTDEHITEELLQQAVQAANDALTQHAQARGSDLGSTITAALIIGSVATVVNVGDSRTYLLRKGDLCQITQDHSLVARLVAAHVIKPEEVRSHPQRNQIYRSLGHETHVEVDTFTVPLQRGDRLILCCDGLWEMVLDPEIQRIVENARTPQQACDALVDAANQAGGEDNISVVVVEIE